MILCITVVSMDKHEQCYGLWINMNKTLVRSSLKLHGTFSSLIVIKTYIENSLLWQPFKDIIEKSKKAT